MTVHLDKSEFIFYGIIKKSGSFLRAIRWKPHKKQNGRGISWVTGKKIIKDQQLYFYL